MTGGEIARKQRDGSPETLCTKCLIAAGVFSGQEDADFMDYMGGVYEPETD
jgi:hypothetical protein